MIKRLDLKLEVKPAVPALIASSAWASCVFQDDALLVSQGPSVYSCRPEKVVGRPPFFAEVLEAI